MPYFVMGLVWEKHISSEGIWAEQSENPLETGGDGSLVLDYLFMGVRLQKAEGTEGAQSLQQPHRAGPSPYKPT